MISFIPSRRKGKRKEGSEVGWKRGKGMGEEGKGGEVGDFYLDNNLLPESSLDT